MELGTDRVHAGHRVALGLAPLPLGEVPPVVVAGDKSVRYEEVILLMVALKKAGVPQVGLMTDPVN